MNPKTHRSESGPPVPEAKIDPNAVKQKLQSCTETMKRLEEVGRVGNWMEKDGKLRESWMGFWNFGEV